MSRPGVMIYFDMAPALKRLSPAKKGALFDAILEYAQFGEIPEFSGVLGVAWELIRPRIDTDNERYNTKCDRARKAINERWQKRNQTDTDEYERIQANTEDTNSTANTNTNTNTTANTNTDTDTTATTNTATTTKEDGTHAARAASSFFGAYNNVKLTDGEPEKLQAEFPSDYAERIR